MPASRSRTQRWRRSLEQLHERGGAIEIAVVRAEEGDGHHLVWRVRVVGLSESEIVVEQPVTLGQPIPMATGIELIGIISVGQNRWMFNTRNLGPSPVRAARDRAVAGLRLAMPESVERCQRRNYCRVPTAALNLPEVEVWPLLDPKSVVLAERASELRFELDRSGRVDRDEEDLLRLREEQLMPEVGPRFTATLANIGGGGIGMQVAPEHGQVLSRHRVYWTRFALPPELQSPICASAKLVHVHLQSDQHHYAGLAFDFSFNAGHHRFVVEQICRFISLQQQRQIEQRARRKSA